MTAYFYTYNIIFDAPVSGNSKLVYAYLCKCADMNGKCYPSHKAIGANAGIGVTTVKKALAELESAGLISVQGQARPDRGRRANIYTVIKENVCGFFLTYINVFDNTLTTKARLVYLYFCRLASGREQAYPSHKATAKACGLSVAGVRTAVDELESAGFIARQAQYRDNGGQRANLYTLITMPEDSDKSAAVIDESNNNDDMGNNIQERNNGEDCNNAEDCDNAEDCNNAEERDNAKDCAGSEAAQPVCMNEPAINLLFLLFLYLRCFIMRINIFAGFFYQRKTAYDSQRGFDYEIASGVGVLHHRPCFTAAIGTIFIGYTDIMT